MPAHRPGKLRPNSHAPFTMIRSPLPATSSLNLLLFLSFFPLARSYNHFDISFKFPHRNNRCGFFYAMQNPDRGFLLSVLRTRIAYSGTTDTTDINILARNVDIWHIKLAR
ncbi:uncharacterized protein EDB91DRAFT_92934 [Suillus paluster]|uniref:uncharacterized protein n=1 Tax=Suillus paluster TaxID=48578 RepID=UPI001B874EB0|nr:uncharacterized protein EDB91DRAFT_92934 [Suillus paluster]KAG1725433.1 hypothetical protein EDB91DRAFT_92934 [Suillus paluster]